MHPNEHILAISDVSTYKSEVCLFVDLIFKGVQVKLAVLGWQLRGRHPVDDNFGALAIGNQVRHSNQRHFVTAGEAMELRHARHCAVRIHDFTDHSGGTQTGQARQVHSRLGLPGSCQHALTART
jgi:hypothetical protein